ncbi:MAG: hypothetical protein ABJL99_12275 [Aliishimia sp.]
MKTIPLLTNDLSSAVRSASKLQIVLPPKSLTFDVSLQVDDDLFEKIKLDGFLADKMFGEVSKIYKVAASHLAKEAERIEKEFFAKDKTRAWVISEWEKTAPAILEKFEPILQKKAEGHLKTWQKVQGDSNKYVVRCVFKVAVGTLGVAAATLGTVVAFGSGGGGVGGVVAIYGLYKAVLALGKEINRQRKDVDQAEAALQKYAAGLIKTYKDASKKKVVGREFATEFLNSLSPAEIKNLNGLNTNFDSFKGKLDRVEKGLSNLSTKLNELIDAQEDLQKDVDRKIKKQLAQRDYKSKRLPKLEAKMSKLHTQTARKIAEVSQGIGKVDGARKREKGYRTAIKELNNKKPGWAGKVEKLIILGDLALGAAFTDFSKLDQLLVFINAVGVEVDGVLAEQI